MATDAVKKTETLEVTTPSEREVAMFRTFDAARDPVFKAWTEPDLVKRWLYGPEEWPMTICKVDLRVGGALRFEWGTRDGKSLGFSGVYREIVPPERLAFTEMWDDNWTGGETLVTMTFVEHAGKTTLKQTVQYSSRDARDAALKTGMARGVAQAFDRLAEILADGKNREI